MGFVAYSPLGRGFLSAPLASLDDLAPKDRRRDHPRFAADNFARNLELIDHHTDELPLLTGGNKASSADHPHPTFSADSPRIEIQSAMLSSDNRSLNIGVVPVPDAWFDVTDAALARIALARIDLLADERRAVERRQQHGNARIPFCHRKTTRCRREPRTRPSCLPAARMT